MMSTPCRIWLQVSFFFNVMMIFQSASIGNWLMVGVSVIGVWCMLLLLKGNLLGLRLYWTMTATIIVINLIHGVGLLASCLNLIDPAILTFFIKRSRSAFH